MVSRLCAVTSAALLAFAGTAAAQTVVQGASGQPGSVQGTVIQVDPGSRVVVLDGGRSIQVTPGTQLTVNGQPVMLENLRPGTVVMVQTAPAAPTRHIVRGVVTDVDREGQIMVKSPNGDEFEVHVSPSTAATVKKGDTMTMEITFQPSAQPAASPALR